MVVSAPSGITYTGSDVASGGTGATTAQGAQANLGGWYMIAKSALTGMSVTGTTDETVLATITVPANAMGPNGILRIVTLWSYTNNSNNKTPRVRFSGAAGSAYQDANFTTTAGTKCQTDIWNTGSASAQVGNSRSGVSGWGASSVAPILGTANTANPTTIVLSGQLAIATDTITLTAYYVEVQYGA